MCAYNNFAHIAVVHKVTPTRSDQVGAPAGAPPSEVVVRRVGDQQIAHRRILARMPSDRMRHHLSPFGEDKFGRWAEAGARLFGTPQYIVGQTVVVIAWIVLNAVAIVGHWDPYPFILLNLAFSTQAAYAAPLILLAQTRQADRDRISVDDVEAHREKLIARNERSEQALRDATAELRKLLLENTELTRQDRELTEQVAALTKEIHAQVAPPAA
jgi:uncharacterized membrane protein